MASLISPSPEDIAAASYVGFDCTCSPRFNGSQNTHANTVRNPWTISYHSADRTQTSEAWLSVQCDGSRCVLLLPLVFSVALRLLTQTYGYVGQTGLGKSTLINTLFASHLIESKGRFEPDVAPRQTTEIAAQSHGTFLCTLLDLLPDFSSCHWPLVVIVENGVRLKLNIVDTPGYGDNVNNEGCWDPIIKYVSSNF